MTDTPATASSQPNNRLGILLMIATTLTFATQDGMSRHLAGEYNVMMVVMIRYWFFGLFVMVVASRAAGGLRAAAATQQPILQISRGLLLAAEICVMVLGFVVLGLVGSQAVFISYPLIIAALSGPVLGESVGWRRWTAIAIGFVGILVCLNPGGEDFGWAAIIPFVAAVLFAVYGLLTRLAARKDSAATSFFWTGAMGAVAMTFAGIWFWEPMAPSDWGWMAALCVCGAFGHWLLIQVYDVAEAGAVQPFAYLQLVWTSLIGVWIFGEVLHFNIVIGAAIVIAAGLFTLWRERMKAA